MTDKKFRDVVYLNPDFRSSGDENWTHVFIVAVEQVGGLDPRTGSPVDLPRFDRSGVPRASAKRLAEYWADVGAQDRVLPPDERRLKKPLATISVVDGVFGQSPDPDSAAARAPDFDTLCSAFENFAALLGDKLGGRTTGATAVVHWIGHGFHESPKFGQLGQAEGSYIFCSGPAPGNSEIPKAINTRDFKEKLPTRLPARSVYLFLDVCNDLDALEDVPLRDAIMNFSAPTPVEPRRIQPGATALAERFIAAIRGSPRFGPSIGLPDSPSYFTEALIDAFDNIALGDRKHGQWHYSFESDMVVAISACLVRLHALAGEPLYPRDRSPRYYLRNLCECIGGSGKIEVLLNPSQYRTELHQFHDADNCTRKALGPPSDVLVRVDPSSSLLSRHAWRVLGSGRVDHWVVEVEPDTEVKGALEWCDCGVQGPWQRKLVEFGVGQQPLWC